MSDAAEKRLVYYRAFNDTMIKIWKERIALLKVIDTGALYNSIIPQKFAADPEGAEVEMAWGFLEYGLYQDRGTGREVPLGNPGDIGRAKVRRAKEWMHLAYYSSVMNIKEFMAESFEQEAIAIFSDTLGMDFRGNIS